MKWVINGGTGELEPINAAKLNLGQRFNLGGLAGRQRFAEAGLADPANNIVKGQDLGTGIQQRLKSGKIKYVTSAVEDTILKEKNSNVTFSSYPFYFKCNVKNITLDFQII